MINDIYIVFWFDNRKLDIPQVQILIQSGHWIGDQSKKCTKERVNYVVCGVVSDIFITLLPFRTKSLTDDSMVVDIVSEIKSASIEL